MDIKRHRRLAGAAVAMVATATLGTGTAGPAQAAPAGNERLIVTFVGADTSPGRVVAAGPIRGLGSVTDSDFQAGPDGTFTARSILIFPEGKIVVTMRGTANDSFDPRTCVGSFTNAGVFTITGADGRFSGATGGGRFVSRGKFFAPRTDQGCGEEGGTEVVVRELVGAVHTPDR